MTGHGAGLLWVVELDSEQQIQHGLVHLVICVSCVISPDGAVEGRMFGYVSSTCRASWELKGTMEGLQREVERYKKGDMDDA
jgi:hypothetical protein